MSVCGPIMAGNGLQQSRQPGYIQAELYLLAAGFLCANSADNTLRLLMATLMYAISNIVRMKKVKIVLNVHLGPDTLPLIARKSTICQSA